MEEELHDMLLKVLGADQTVSVLVALHAAAEEKATAAAAAAATHPVVAGRV